MKAISIRQPWAWAILCAGKDVENRTWTHNYRGPILIHAAKNFDYEGYAWIQDNLLKLNYLGKNIPLIQDIPRGGIVGRVTIKKMVRSIDYSPWMFGPWGWVLENPVSMKFKPMKGKLGLFEVEV